MHHAAFCRHKSRSAGQTGFAHRHEKWLLSIGCVHNGRSAEDRDLGRMKTYKFYSVKFGAATMIMIPDGGSFYSIKYIAFQTCNDADFRQRIVSDGWKLQCDFQ